MDAFDENYWTISIYLIVVVAIGTIVGNVITALFGLLYKSISYLIRTSIYLVFRLVYQIFRRWDWILGITFVYVLWRKRRYALRFIQS